MTVHKLASQPAQGDLLVDVPTNRRLASMLLLLGMAIYASDVLRGATLFPMIPVTGVPWATYVLAWSFGIGRFVLIVPYALSLLGLISLRSALLCAFAYGVPLVAVCLVYNLAVLGAYLRDWRGVVLAVDLLTINCVPLIVPAVLYLFGVRTIQNDSRRLARAALIASTILAVVGSRYLLLASGNVFILEGAPRLTGVWPGIALLAYAAIGVVPPTLLAATFADCTPRRLLAVVSTIVFSVAAWLHSASYVVSATSSGWRSDLWGRELSRAVAWLPLALFALALWFVYCRPQRPGPLACARCGYSLLGNTSGRCPECGLVRHA